MRYGVKLEEASEVKRRRLIAYLFVCFNNHNYSESRNSTSAFKHWLHCSCMSHTRHCYYLNMGKDSTETVDEGQSEATVSSHLNY